MGYFGGKRGRNDISTFVGCRSFNVRMSHWSFVTPIARRILESHFNYDISQNNWKIIADGVATSRLWKNECTNANKC